ncbi:UDP-N-acetylhexosamine pyrophosphorylase, partial [Eumeta japonica]
MNNYIELHKRLAQVGQEHLLKFWDELSAIERTQLERDISGLNLNELKLYFDRATVSLTQNSLKLDDHLQPIPESKVICISQTTEEILNGYRDEGLKQISLGHVAVLLMAGGQGTRLGFAYPKGMYDVGLQSRKTLFRLQAERILKLQELAFDATGKKGVITCVDNILIKVADPVFIGYCVQQNADCAAKVVEKSSPSEAVGVVAIVDVGKDCPSQPKPDLYRLHKKYIEAAGGFVHGDECEDSI